MRLLNIAYGNFPKVFKLYSRFQPDVGHLKVVLDVFPQDGFDRAKFLTLFRQLAEFFPTITQHSCCEGWETAPLYIEQEDGVSIKRVGECADMAHLIEHVIVDMQVSLGGMQRCSGITCGWKDPENRFDLFVECINARIGLFAARFALHLANKMLNNMRISGRNRLVLLLARFLQEHPKQQIDVDSISQELGWTQGNTAMALTRLNEFGFFWKENDRSDAEGNCA
jgi:hypothetical protein